MPTAKVTVIYIEVKEVQRQNFRGEVEPVSVSKQFNIPLL